MEKGKKLSSAPLALPVVTVPLRSFVVPRLYLSLPPDPIVSPRGKVDMDPSIRIGFAAMLLGFTGLFAWLVALRVRVARLEHRHEEI
jgi:heme exporter protein C